MTSTTIILCSLMVGMGVGCKPSNTTSLDLSLGFRMGGLKVDWCYCSRLDHNCMDWWWGGKKHPLASNCRMAAFQELTDSPRMKT